MNTITKLIGAPASTALGTTMSGRRRALGALSAAAFGLSGLVVLAEPAAAVALSCGDVVTTSVTLTNDLQNCTGNGLVIGADNITVDLNGHTISGSTSTNMGTAEFVGVLLRGVRNVIVLNGTVRDFDAGVAIVRGAGNQIRRLTVRDNVNHSTITGAINRCKYGDGITVADSRDNVIAQNEAFRNGPFSGISLVGNADGNIVSENSVHDQNVDNLLPLQPGQTAQENGPCGPFSATPTGAGRAFQDIGIRVEGPGADNNQVLSNSSTDNHLNGISVHGYVCGAPAGANPPPPLGTSNSGNLIQGNLVSHNGFAPDGARLDGIGILRQGPFGVVVCASRGNKIVGNDSTDNGRDGIGVPPTGDVNFPSAANTVRDNTVNRNGRFGIRVDGPFTVCPSGQSNTTGPTFCNVPRQPRVGSTDNVLVSNQGTGNGVTAVAPTIAADGFDGNPMCDNNTWRLNIFGKVNQACVKANGGTGTVVGPAVV